MKNIINLIICLIIGVLCAGSLVAEDKKPPDRNVRALRELIAIENTTAELYNTEVKYVEMLNDLIKLEEKLKVPEGGLSWFFTKKEKQDKIIKQNKRLDKEILNLNEILRINNSLKGLLATLKDNSLAPNRSLLEAETLDIDKEFNKEKFGASSVTLNAISKTLSEHGAELNNTLSYQNFARNYEENKEENLTNFRSIKMVNRSGKPVKINDLRSSVLQRVASYQLLFEAYADHLPKLLVLLDNESNKLAVGKVIAAANPLEARAIELVRNIRKAMENPAP